MGRISKSYLKNPKYVLCVDPGATDYSDSTDLAYEPDLCRLCDPWL